MVVASKQTIVELLVLALHETELKDMGLDAMRAVLRSDPRLSVLDGALDLEPVWELLSHQPEFKADPSAEARCFVKGLEARLGISLKMPSGLAEFSELDIQRRGALVKPKREDVDKIINTPTVEDVATSGALPNRPKTDVAHAWAPAAKKRERRFR